MSLSIHPWSVKQGKPWVELVHRHLDKVNGAKWAVRLERDGQIVGCALVGPAARLLGDDVLCVIRVAVIEGVYNGCSMLYGACSRAARAMGAEDLVTYTRIDEPGTTLRAAGWIDGGMTEGGEHDRASRHRAPSRDPRPKRRWWAPWGRRARAFLEAA